MVSVIVIVIVIGIGLGFALLCFGLMVWFGEGKVVSGWRKWRGKELIVAIRDLRGC